MGEFVEFEGVVYECTGHPARCNQAGYEPGSEHESDAWTLLGSCEGTIAPTVATTIDPWEKTGCPEAYDSSATYEEESEVSLDDVVYRCKIFPDNGFCNLHNPYSYYGYLGWETLGSCKGTIVPTSIPTSFPTSSPSYGPTYPKWEKVGCPQEFDESLGTDYDDLETVARDEVVYECKAWPSSARCKQAGYEPGTGEDWGAAWTVLGSCDGTLIPTSSPTPEDFSDCSAPAYDTSASYVAGDQVQADGEIHECRGGVWVLWCNNPAYMPGTTAGQDVWNNVGSC